MSRLGAGASCIVPVVPIERYGWIEPMFYSPEDEEDLCLDAAFAEEEAAAADDGSSGAAAVVAALCSPKSAAESLLGAGNARAAYQFPEEWARVNPCPTPEELFEWKDDPCAAQGIEGGWAAAWDETSPPVPPQPWRGPPLPPAFFQDLPADDYACLLPYALHGENAQEMRLQEAFSDTDEVFLAFCEEYVDLWDDYWEAVLRFVCHRRGRRLAHEYGSSEAYRADVCKWLERRQRAIAESRDRPADAA
jgi:hypothetical protein